MKNIIGETKVGTLTIKRQRDNQYRVVTADGIGVCTVSTYQEAVRAASDNNTMATLVKMAGKETAIELIRAGALRRK